MAIETILQTYADQRLLVGVDYLGKPHLLAIDGAGARAAVDGEGGATAWFFEETLKDSRPPVAPGFFIWQGTVTRLRESQDYEDSCDYYRWLGGWHPASVDDLGLCALPMVQAKGGRL